MSILDEPDAWPADRGKSTFLARAVAIAAKRLPFDRDDLLALLWRALKDGEVLAGVSPVAAGDFLLPMPLPPPVFLRMKPAALFGTCQIEWRDTNPRRPVRTRPAIPVPQFVYVSIESLERWCDQNAPSQADATVAAEKAAREHVAARFRMDPNLTREDALVVAREVAPNLSENGFLTRVWPRARELAGLLAKAPPGRKSTKKSTS